MKVFLTGASGFLGSHILDLLCASQLEVTLLLRSTSNTRFIARHLPTVEVRYGSLNDVKVLKSALQGSEVVIPTSIETICEKVSACRIHLTSPSDTITTAGRGKEKFVE